MAVVYYRGDAPVVYQVATSVLTGTYASGETATLTINGRSIIITAPAAGLTAAQMADALVAAVNGAAITGEGESRNTTGDLIPEFSGIIASIGGTTATFVLTADTERPFVATTDEDAASGTFPSFTATTAASGPSHVVAANMSTGSLPENGDTLVFRGAVNALYGLDALSAIDLARVVFEAGFTGNCGLPVQFTTDAGSSYEYLPTHLELAADTAVDVGLGDGTGSSRIKIDLGGGNSAVTVATTGPSLERDRYAVQIKGAGASSTLYVSGGQVDVCREYGETCTFATVLATGNARVRLGEGCTLTTVTAEGSAQVELLAAATTVNVFGSATFKKRNGAVTTLNAYAGTSQILGSGTIGTTNLGAAVLDLSQNTLGATLTDMNITSDGFTLNDPGGRGTYTNAIAFTGVSPAAGTFQVGPGRSIAVS